MTPADARREWRQLRLLSRDAVRRLLDSVLFSRDTDPVQFVIWMAALAATPLLFHSTDLMLSFAALRTAPPEVIERAAFGHRLYYATYSMLVATMLAALMWDALFPDRSDHEVIGVLPVRPWVPAAGRLGAAASVAAVFLFAINVPSAVAYTLISGTAPAVGSMPGVLAGQLTGPALAGLFVFFSLLSLRGIASLAGGVRLTDWIGRLFLLAAIVSMIASVVFMPSLLSWLQGLAFDVAGSWRTLPPVWFAAWQAWIAGGGPPGLEPMAQRAPLALLAAGALAALVYLVPATRTSRRAVDTRTGDRRRPAAFAGRAAALAIRTPAVHAIVVFTVASLMRSRRHALLLAMYLGLAAATMAVSLVRYERRHEMLLSEPAAYLLALPLVVMFFATLGLKASFAVPTDIGANWPFRLTPPSVDATATATRLVLFGLGVLPVAVVTLLVGLLLWAPTTAAAVALLQIASGQFLVEVALLGWTKVPFACTHEPSSDTVRWHWVLGLVALNLYGFRLADAQAAALHSTAGVAWLATVLTAAAMGARVWGARSTKARPLAFDAASETSLDRLDLSDALR